MYSTIFSLMNSMDLILGICIGVVITTILYIFATYIDYKRMLKEAKEKVYESFDWEEILFNVSYWDRRQVMEIILPEV